MTGPYESFWVVLLTITLACLISLLCWFNAYIVVLFCSVLLTLVAMECQFCCTVVYKKEWSAGQWREWSPYANGFVGCKTCRKRQECGPEVPLNVLSSKAPFVQQFAVHLKKGRICTWWPRLIFYWMQQLDSNYRKQLSYLGAVRCFDETHKPAFYVCSYLGETFDPGNNTYAMLLKVLVPTIVNMSWNAEDLPHWLENDEAGFLFVIFMACSRLSTFLYFLMIQRGACLDCGCCLSECVYGC